MSMNTKNGLPWSTEDEQHWNAFLATPTGQRLIPKLGEATPILLARGHVNAVLIRSGEVRGCQAMLQTMLDLTHSPERIDDPISMNYPDPENDAAWNDGEKLITK